MFPVQFSRVRDDVGKVADDEAIFEPKKSVAKVAFGYAPILQPGTVWKDGVSRTRWPFNQIIVKADVASQSVIIGVYGKHHLDGEKRYFLPPG